MVLDMPLIMSNQVSSTENILQYLVGVVQNIQMQYYLKNRIEHFVTVRTLYAFFPHLLIEFSSFCESQEI